MSTLIVGCGYLGRRVGRVLADRGERVFGTTRSASKAGELSALGIEPVIADVLDPGSLARLPTADRVLACVGYDRAGGVPMRTVYVDGLRQVIERIVGASRLVYASATSVYGQNDGGWVDESSPTVPTTESGRVCLEAEQVARRLGAERGLAVNVVRFSGLYGPGRLPSRGGLVRGEPVPGDPERYLNLIQIDDAATATVAALDRGIPGRGYLISDDRPIHRREYYELVARLLNAPTPRFEATAASQELPNKRVSNRRMREELGVVLAYPDITSGVPASLA